jgi:hypothetical protein
VVEKIAALFDSGFLFFLLTSALTYIPPALYLVEEWDDEKNILALAIFTFLFGFYPFGLAAIKQGIAMSLCFYSLKYVYSRKLVRFAVFVALASLFHPTALVFAPVYFLWSKNGHIKMWKKVLAILICLVSMYGMEYVLEIFGGRFEGYSEAVGGSNMTFWLMGIWVIIFLYFRKSFIYVDSRNDLLIILFIMGAVFQYLGFSNAFTKRIGEYFLVTQTILLPQMKFVCNKNSQRLIFSLVIFYDVMMFVLQYVILGQSAIVPYSFIL